MDVDGFLFILPYFLLLFCVILSCLIYRCLRIPECYSLFNRHERRNNPRRFLNWFTRRNAAEQEWTIANGTEPNTESDQNGSDEASQEILQNLLVRNLNRASQAHREAVRIASIIALNRGMSTAECLQNVRTLTQIQSTEAIPEDDQPPRYEECVNVEFGVPSKDELEIDKVEAA